MIRIKDINYDNFNECIDLKVKETQKNFVMPNMKSLAKAYVFKDCIEAISIYSDDTMVGFGLIKSNDEYDWYNLWQVMIDEKYQNMGYGKLAIQEIIRMKKDEGLHSKFVATVVEGNELTEKLFYQLGFKAMSEMYDGEIDLYFDLK